MSSDSNTWKSKLLSSSVPLEYEAARILSSEKFWMTTDYTYGRDDAGVVKDFSVDIHAVAYPPFTADTLNAQLDLLVECKYRHPTISWLFFPDPNEEDNSLFIIGSTLRVVDGFSRYFIPPNATIALDQAATFCLKGVEVNTKTGDVLDAQIRHGLSQLQYALPRLLSDEIRFNAFAHPDDNLPLLFCPVLLTTAQLLVARRDVSVADICGASDLTDIATPVDYVVVGVDSGPDFERHRIREFEELNALTQHPAMLDLDEYRKNRGVHQYSLPSSVAKRLANPGPPSPEYFGQYLVCTMPAFPSLIKRIKSIALSAARARRKSPARRKHPA